MPGTVRHKEGVTPVQKPDIPSTLATWQISVQTLGFGDCWSLVLIRSRGWSRTVEQEPLRAPARKDLNIGLDIALWADLVSVESWFAGLVSDLSWPAAVAVATDIFGFKIFGLTIVILLITILDSHMLPVKVQPLNLPSFSSLTNTHRTEQ